MGKRDLANMVKEFEMRRLIWNIWVCSIKSHGSFPDCGQRGHDYGERTREVAVLRVNPTVLTLKTEEGGLELRGAGIFQLEKPKKQIFS